MINNKMSLIFTLFASVLLITGCDDESSSSNNSAGSTPPADDGPTFTPRVDHTIAFYDMDGELIEEVGKRNGEIFTVSAPPEPEGYEHIGWDHLTFRQSRNSFKAMDSIDIQAIYQRTDEAIRQSNPDNNCIQAAANTTCEVDGETIIKIGENWGISPNDEAHMIRWGRFTGETYMLYEQSISEENGRANSSLVTQVYPGDGEAIELCTNKGDNWYLPALEELKQIHANKETISNIKGDLYWSSTTIAENSDIYAMAFGDNHRHINDGEIRGLTWLLHEANVRCARIF